LNNFKDLKKQFPKEKKKKRGILNSWLPRENALECVCGGREYEEFITSPESQAVQEEISTGTVEEVVGITEGREEVDILNMPVNELKAVYHIKYEIYLFDILKLHLPTLTIISICYILQPPFLNGFKERKIRIQHSRQSNILGDSKRLRFRISRLFYCCKRKNFLKTFFA